jgi:hypothetical protein
MMAKRKTAKRETPILDHLSLGVHTGATCCRQILKAVLMCRKPFLRNDDRNKAGQRTRAVY